MSLDVMPMPDQDQNFESADVLRADFIPTPERINQFLEKRTIEETRALLLSIEGRQQLLQELLEHEEYLKTIHPGFNADRLEYNLKLVAETLQEEMRYLEDMSDPEKKSIFSRAWDSVKGFAKENKLTTAVLLAALATATVAAGFYFTGNWELLMTHFGLDKVFGSAEAAGELIPPTPATPTIPEGGVFHSVPPSSPPGPIVPGIDTPN